MEMQTTEFEKKLIEILERNHYVPPTQQHLSKICEKLENVLEPDQDTEAFILAHTRYFTLIEKKEYAVIFDFFKFLQEKYENYNTFSKGGMSKYMQDHEINNSYKSVLVKKSFLTTQMMGGRYYRFNLKNIRYQDVYNTILDHKHITGPKGQEYILTKEDQSMLIEPADDDKRISLTAQPDASEETIEVKEELKEEAPKQPEEVEETKEEEVKEDQVAQYRELVAKIPPADASIKESLFKERIGRYNDDEHLMLVWCVYRGFTSMQITQIIKRGFHSVNDQRKKFATKELNSTELQEKYLINKLGPLLKLFKTRIKLSDSPKNTCFGLSSSTATTTGNDSLKLGTSTKIDTAVTTRPENIEIRETKKESKLEELERRISALEQLVVEISKKLL